MRKNNVSRKILALVLVLAFLIILPGCERHTIKHFDAKAPSCTEPGHTAYSACTDEGCNFAIGYKELAPTGHNMIEMPGKKPTQDADGYSAYTTCLKCGIKEGYTVLEYVPEEESIPPTLDALLPATDFTIPALEERPLIRDLSDSGKAVMRELYDAVMSFATTHTFTEPIPKDDFNKYMFLLNYCCPEIMQISGDYSFAHTDKYASSVTFSYIMTRSEYEKAYNDVFDIVGRIVNTTKEMAEIEKEKFVYDLLINTCTYDKTTRNAGNPYGLLIEGRARCEGYSKTFSLMMWAMGIECYTVFGTAGEAHSWNIVKLDEKYYFADATWDDKDNGSIGYFYFNVDLDTMTRAGHYLSPMLEGTLPTCDSLDMSIPMINDTHISSEQNVRERLAEIVAEVTARGGKDLYIRVSNSMQLSTLENAALKTVTDYIAANFSTYNVNVTFEKSAFACHLTMTYY